MMTLRWLGMSIVVVIIFFGLLWLNALSKSQAREIALQLQAKQPQVPVGPRQEYVLEVIGLGVTLDKYRQGKLWDVLQKGSAYTSIREQDPRKYPWTGDDKDGEGGSRAYDALENGINFTPM